MSNTFWIRLNETKPPRVGKYFAIITINDQRHPVVLWWDGNNFLQNMYGRQKLNKQVSLWSYIPDY